MRKFFVPLLFLVIGVVTPNYAQNTIQANPAASKLKNELKYNLTEDGSKYIKFTFLNQVWLRWNQSNNGTTVNGVPENSTVDIGLRRTRLQLFGQISDHVFFYTQFGMNNFNYLSQNSGNRKNQAFFHDAVSEYKVFKNNDKLKLGGGLTIVNGLSRFTQPSVGTILTADVPVFAQATVDQTDQFARKLSVYARGQVGKLDYRMAISDPFPIQTNGQIPPKLGKFATFTTIGHTKQYQGYLSYNILDKEPHTTPYMAGTYLGDKKVLNLEGGMIYQKDATWYSSTGIDTVFNTMKLWSLAVFADMPVQDNKYAISAYAGYFNTDYGRNYIRNNGIMNPANGTTDQTNFSGAGNAYPMFGTGETLYAQVGVRLPKDMLGDNGTLLPYISYRYSDYTRLADPVTVWNTGVNWLINKHQAKLSLNYEIRPEFSQQGTGSPERIDTKNTAWIQYQVFF